MGEIREELIQAITIVATSTGMTVAECIEEALKILKEEQKRRKKQLMRNHIKTLFKGW